MSMNGKLNPDGSIDGADVIDDAQVTLSVPASSEGGIDLHTLFDCVEDFHASASQSELFVYTVETHGRTFEVDWGSKTVTEITDEVRTRSPVLIVFRNSDSAVEGGWPPEPLELRADGGAQLTWECLREIETGRVLATYGGPLNGWCPVDHDGNYSDVEIVNRVRGG